MRRALAWEWADAELEPATEAETIATAAIDLLLIEVHSGVVPGYGAPGGLPAQLAAATRERQVPVVVWVTAGSADPDTAAPLPPSAAVVFVADGSRTGRWRDRWPQMRAAAGRRRAFQPAPERVPGARAAARAVAAALIGGRAGQLTSASFAATRRSSTRTAPSTSSIALTWSRGSRLSGLPSSTMPQTGVPLPR